MIVDFSHPSLLGEILRFAREKKVSAVICTTGLSPEQVSEIRESAKEVPIFFSANMSLGINLLSALAQKAAQVLGGQFDIEILEKHHNQKVDAPSGTALMLADAINEVADGRYEYVYDRHSVRRKRGKEELGIHSVRGGTIVGEHEVIFAGRDEVLTLSPVSYTHLREGWPPWKICSSARRGRTRAVAAPPPRSPKRAAKAAVLADGSQMAPPSSPPMPMHGRKMFDLIYLLNFQQNKQLYCTILDPGKQGNTGDQTNWEES